MRSAALNIAAVTVLALSSLLAPLTIAEAEPDGIDSAIGGYSEDGEEIEGDHVQSDVPEPGGELIYAEENGLDSEEPAAAFQLMALTEERWWTGPTVLQVGVGQAHACVLLSDGNVDCYGNNQFTQSVDYLGGDGVQISVGFNQNCVLTSAKHVICWGENNFGQAADRLTGDNTKVVSAEAHNCALKVNGNVDCWGANTVGQSADRLNQDNINVGVGKFHTCVIKVNRNVDCYGLNDGGQSNDHNQGNAADVRGGRSFTCIVTVARNVDCYGSSVWNQAADDYTGGDVEQIDGGPFGICVIVTGKTVKCHLSGDVEYVVVDTIGDAADIDLEDRFCCDLYVVRELGWVDSFGASIPFSEFDGDYNPPPEPETPLNLRTTTGPGRGTITIEWDPSGNDYHVLGYPITYNIQAFGDAERTQYLFGTNVGEAISFVHGGLADDQVVYYSVYACLRFGCSPESEVVAGRTEAFDPPGLPVNVTTVPGPAVGEVTVQWQRPLDRFAGIESYRIQRGASASGPFTLVGTSGPTSLTLRDTGLTLGQTYYYRVAAVNKNGQGPFTEPVAARTDDVPGAPRELEAASSGTQVQLAWKPPLGDGGRPIEAYRVYGAPSGQAPDLLLEVPAPTTQAALACASACTFHVRAVNAVGESAPSNQIRSDSPPRPVPESLRGSTPGAGVDLHDVVPCGPAGSGSINLVSGQFAGSTCLLWTRNPVGLDIRIELTHRSNGNSAGPAGNNWYLNLVRRIDVDANGDVLLESGTGRLDRFTFEAATGTYRSPPGLYQRLASDGAGGFTLAMPGGTVERFDAQGRRTSVEDAVGNNARFTYDLQGRLIQVDDLPGRSLTLQYQGHRLASISDFAGRTAVLEHEPDGDLASLLGPGQEAPHRYAYDATHALVTARLPSGETALENTYDAEGRVERQFDGLGVTEVTYDPLSRTTLVEDQAGHLVQWGYVSAERPLLAFKTDVLSDAAPGFPAELTTTYVVNADGETVRVEMPDGQVHLYEFDSANPDVLAHGNLLSGTEVPAPVDGLQGEPRTTTFTYEPAYQRLRSQTSPASGGGVRTTTYSYGQDENTAGDLNGDGVVGGSPSQLVHVALPTGEEGPRSETYWHNERGQMIRAVRADGTFTTYSYFEEADVDFTRPLYFLARVEQFEPAQAFTASLKTEDTEHDSPSQQDVGQRRATFDDQGGETPAPDEDKPEAPEEPSSQRLAAEISDLLLASQEFTYTDTGMPAAVTDGLGRTVTYGYDAAGRLVTETGPDPAVVRTSVFDEDGGLVATHQANAIQGLDGSFTLDPNHPLIEDRFVQDVHGNLIASAMDATRPAGLPGGQPEQLLQEYGYDAAGRLVVARTHGFLNGTNPDGITTFVYDGLGNLEATSVGGATPEFLAANPDVDLGAAERVAPLYLAGAVRSVDHCQAVPAATDRFCGEGPAGECPAGAILRVGAASVCALPSGLPVVPPGVHSVGDLPSARMGAATVWDPVRGKAYVFGGWSAHALDEVVEADPTGATKVVGRLPSARWASAAFFDGRSAYVLGGCLTQSCEKATDEILRFDPQTGDVSLVGKLPQAVGGAAVAWTGSTAYLLGACGHPCKQGSIIAFDPATGTASALGATISDANPFMAAFFDGRVAWVLGLGPARQGVATFDPATGALAAKGSPLPPSKGGLAAAWDGQAAYVVSARQGDSSAPVLQFHPASATVETLEARLAPAVTDAAAVWTGSSLLVLGGDAAAGARSAAIRLLKGPDPSWEWSFSLAPGLGNATPTVAVLNQDGPLQVTWSGIAGPEAVDGNAVLAAWMLSPSASGDLTVDAAIRSEGQTLATGHAAFAPSPPGEPREVRIDLGRIGLAPGQTVALDLSWSTTSGRALLLAGPAAPSRLEIGDVQTSTTQYDPLGRPTVVTDANGLQTLLGHDGYGRPTSAVDPLGALHATVLDGAGQPVERSTVGPLVEGGPSVLLEASSATYDLSGRVTSIQRAAFDPATGMPLAMVPDGSLATTLAYDSAGRLIHVADEAGDGYAFTYDGLGRVRSWTDAVGNHVELAYDLGGNIVARTAIDIGADGSPLAPATTAYGYDLTGNLVSVTDPLGRTIRSGYDTRGNLVWQSDARTSERILDPLTGVETNGHGNIIRYAYDASDRLVATMIEMREGGTGDGALLETIITTQEWDGDSRLVRQADGEGNSTAYAYDAMGRLVATTFADGTQELREYDAGGRLVTIQEANGNRVTNHYGDGGLLARRAVAGDVTHSTEQAFRHDGLGRLVEARDNNDAGDSSTASVVRLAYDSLGRVTEDDQDGLLVSRVYDGQGNRVRLHYPNGRVIDGAYDALGRLTALADAGATLASFEYEGTDRLSAQTAGNGVRSSYSYDAARQVLSIVHALADPLEVRYEHDAVGNRVAETLVHAPEWSRQSRFDSLGRVTSVQHGLPAELSPTTDPLLDVLPERQDWVLDRANNWDQVTRISSGVQETETRTHDATNALTSITVAGEPVQYVNDASGDRLADGRHTYAWDGLHRLRAVADVATGDLVASYTYDAFGRRTTKTVHEGGSTVTTRFLYDGPNVIEEHTGDTVTQFVHGSGLDRPVLMDRDLDGDGLATGTADSRMYYLQDALGSVVGLMDASGRLREGYLYDAYGRAIVLQPGASGVVEWDASDLVATWSALGNPYMFTGQRLDRESGLYHYRARYYDPGAGVFLSRDPIGTWGDATSLGNAFAYVGNNPLMRIDPSGGWCLMNCIRRAFRRVADATVSVVRNAVTTVADAFESTYDYFVGAAHDFADYVQSFDFDPIAILGRAGAALDEYLGRTVAAVESFVEAAGSFFGEVGAFIGEVGQTIADEYVGTWECIRGRADCQEELCTGFDATLPWNALGCHAAAVNQAAREGTLCTGLSPLATWECLGKVQLGFTMPLAEAALMGLGVSSLTGGAAAAGAAGRSGAAVSAPAPKFVPIVNPAVGERIVFGHGARHLAGTGLSQEAVETAITVHVRASVQGSSSSGAFWGRIVVEGRTIEYRAYTLADGTINVGTYYPKGF